MAYGGFSPFSGYGGGYGGGGYGGGYGMQSIRGGGMQGMGGMGGMFGGGMFAPRMMQSFRPQMPMQASVPQFSAGGGDPYTGGRGNVDPYDPSSRMDALNAMAGQQPATQSFSSTLGQPTQAPQVQTGGGSPLEGGMSAGGDNFGSTSPPPQPQQAAPQQNAMQMMMQNVGGFRMPSTSGMFAPPTQAPSFSAGGGDPYTPQQSSQVQNMALGAPTGLTPNSGMMQMNRIAAGSAPAAYGGGGTNWQDRPIGAMPQGPGIPAGWTADPNASGNPYWQSILNSRGPWTYNRG